jgi:glycerol dehydrogenase-like iron-containing ADH family enzyme
MTGRHNDVRGESLMSHTAEISPHERLSYGFNTVFGRNLLPELPNFVHPPFCIVTMEDIWPLFRDHFSQAECSVHFVDSIERSDLESCLIVEGDRAAFVSLGGGQAIDVAKYFAWRLQKPLFTVPTALSVNAAWGQRSGVRDKGAVRYVGWAVPETVYLDYDVIRAAPPKLNYSGICDVLCFHTGVLDWQYAAKIGKVEEKWPWDPKLAAQSLEKVEALLAIPDEVRTLSDEGLRVLVDGLSWGTSYHGSGWCPRHIEGIDHFLFYALEHKTGKKFLHGQPVCLGIVLGSMLHDSRASQMMDFICAVGLDIRPEAMGIDWADVEDAAIGLKEFVTQAGLWHSIAHDVQIESHHVEQLRECVEDAYR